MLVDIKQTNPYSANLTSLNTTQKKQGENVGDSGQNQSRSTTAASGQAAVKTRLDAALVDTVVISGAKKDSNQQVGGNQGGQSVDQVNLSTTFSIEEVNRLMESEIGKKVADMFKEAAIDPSSIADTDWSPEATAERIFQGTTGMFEIWREQHKDQSEAELIDSFEEVLRKSVDKGAEEAIGLIKARLFDNEDSVVGTAMDTMSLVHKKFDDFFENLRANLESPGDDASAKNSEVNNDKGPSQAE